MPRYYVYIDAFDSPREILASAMDAYRYCLAHWHERRAINVTNEDNIVILSTQGRVLSIPLGNGDVQQITLA